MSYIDFHVHATKNIDIIISKAQKAKVSKVVLFPFDVSLEVLDREDIKQTLRERIEEALTLDPYLSIIFGRDPISSFKKLLIRTIEKYNILTDGEEAIRLYSQFSDLFIPFISINPNLGINYIMDKIKKACEMNIRGIFLSPTLQLFNPSTSKEFKLIVELAEKNDLLIVMHCGCDIGPFEIPILSKDAHPKNIIPILETYDVTIILSSFCSKCANHPTIWLNDTLKILKKFDNVFTDTSGVNSIIFGKEELIRRIRKEVGFEKVLFGSDYPFNKTLDIENEIKYISNSPALSSIEKEMILYENAADILKRYNMYWQMIYR